MCRCNDHFSFQLKNDSLAALEMTIVIDDHFLTISNNYDVVNDKTSSVRLVFERCFRCSSALYLSEFMFVL